MPASSSLLPPNPVGQKNQFWRRRRYPLTVILSVVVLASLCSGFKKNELQGDGTTMTEMLDYMQRFGYMPDSSGDIGYLMTVQEIRKSVKIVQRLAGLEQTGRLDDATARYIKMPRCGVTDYNLVQSERQEVAGERGRRGKRYAHYSIGRDYAKWDKKELTWSLDRRGTAKVDRRSVISDLERSFRLWSDSSSLRFRRVEEGEEKVDIEIRFERGGHGDGYAFDGQGQALAHAFPPQGGQYDGDMHMDDDEFWKSHEDAKKSTGPSASIFVVAAHELGHSLGLDHSKDSEALMFAAYTGPRDFVRLPDDDRMGIQVLYGPNDQSPSFPVDPALPPRMATPPPPPTTQRPRPPPPPRVYPPPRTTTTTTTTRTPWISTRTRPPVVWPAPPQPPRQTPPSRRPPPPPSRRPPPPPTRRYPHSTTTAAPPPPSVDFCNTIFDVVTTIRGELFLFKNELMWRVKGSQVLGPTRIADFWLGLPADMQRVDTVYERQGATFDIVFFIGQRYYSFFDTRMHLGYPRPLTMLGLPPDVERVEAALAWGHRGRTYLFSGRRYWRLDEITHRVEPAKDMASNWRGVPLPPSSAFRWTDGKTYFIQDQLFWEFNERNKTVSHPTGRLVSSFWLGCPWRSTDAAGGGGDGDEDVEDNSVQRQKHRLAETDGIAGSSSTTAASCAGGGGLLLLFFSVLFLFFM